MTSAQAVSRHRKKRKRELIKVMGGKCAICGYNKCESALQFHHLNPKEKKYELSSGNCKKIQEDFEEAKKCILICSNCHREIHAGLIDNSKLKTSFNEQIANQILEEYDAKNSLKEKRQNFCIDCGKPIAIGSIRCTKCQNEKRTKILKDYPFSREELKSDIRHLPLTKVAQKYGYTDMREICKKFSLPCLKREINSYSDEQWDKI